MEIKYKIIEVNEETYSIVVRFYTDDVPESQLSTFEHKGKIIRASTDINLDLPHPPPTGADLEAYIMVRAPLQFLLTQKKVLDPNIDTSMPALKAAIGVEKVVGATLAERQVHQDRVTQFMASMRAVLDVA